MSPILGIYASQISGHLWAPAGAYDSIATATGTGSSGTITFSSIPSTYTHLQIRGLYTPTTDTDTLVMYLNSDTASNYSRHWVYGNGTTTSAAGGSTTAIIVGTYNGGNATYPTATVIDILDYANTNKYKTTRALSGIDRNGGSFNEIGLYSGNWRNTAAVTSITLSCGQFTTNTRFALYGIRGN